MTSHTVSTMLYRSVNDALLTTSSSSLQASIDIPYSISHTTYSILGVSREPRLVVVDRGIKLCGWTKLAVGMADRGAKALTDEDAKLFIGNLSYHVSNFYLF